jgi:hypothetical protein
MSTTTAHPVPERGAPWGPGRVALLVGGSLAALIAFALLTAGLMVVLAHVTARDSAGFYTSSTERFTTQTYALTSEGMQIGDIRGDGADWALDAFDATVRVRATTRDGDPVFIGIAREQDVDRYLAQSAHEEISDVHAGPFSYDSVRRGGTAMPGSPTTATFWAASASGPGTQAVTWKPDIGRWAVVVMNADRSSGVDADISLGAKSGAILPIGLGLLGVGLLGLAAAVGLLLIAVREERRPPGGTHAITQAPAAPDAPIAERPHPCTPA